MNEQHIPVIVGIGQLIDRHPDDQEGLEPLALIQKAIQLADQDSGGTFLRRTDSLDIEAVTSWPYDDLCGLLIKQLGINPTRAVLNGVSGDTPIRNLCDAARRIAEGTSTVVLICGAEAASSVRHAMKHGKMPSSWTPPSSASLEIDLHMSDLDVKYGLIHTVSNYAMYENACRSSWGQSFAEGQAETGRMWSRASQIAVECPFGWIKRPRTSDEIATPSSENRMLDWPYTKLMVANNFVNGGTAILLTSLALAKEARIPESRLVYVGPGGYANESHSLLERDSYTHSAAMETVLHHLMEASGVGARAFDFGELYSCFPVVPKMAKRVLGWDENRDFTIFGGMTFGGGQLTNYMSQCACEMVRKLRERGTHGLLYGNGHFVTNAAGLVLSRIPPVHVRSALWSDLQYEVGMRLYPAPAVIESYAGDATVETYTVHFGSDGKPEHGTVIARTPKGQRFAAITREVETLIDPENDPIGRPCTVVQKDGLNVVLFPRS